MLPFDDQEKISHRFVTGPSKRFLLILLLVFTGKLKQFASFFSKDFFDDDVGVLPEVAVFLVGFCWQETSLNKTL